MSTVMDRRLAVRRRSVSEDGARRRLRRLLALVVLVGAGALAGWLLYHSSLLSLTEVTVGGQSRSRADQILADEGVVTGSPTIRVKAGDIERALISDPWIAAAVVRVTWPGTVTVDVLEHVPAGWVEAASLWLLTTADGHVLEVAEAPTGSLAIVSVGSAATAPGESLDELAAAGLTFVEALSPRLARTVIVRGEAGALTAAVDGYHVELGYPLDMVEKAAALTALLESGVMPASNINLVSPTRPAIKSQQVVESS